MEWWSLGIFKGFRTETTNTIFCLSRCQRSDEIFSRQSFLDRVLLRVSYTCSCNYSVYDGVCTHTHLLHAHFSAQRAHSHICTIFMRVHMHAWLRAQAVSKRCLLHMNHIFPSCFLHLMFHPFLLVLVQPFRHHLSAHLLGRHFPSWKRRTCATPHLHRRVWLFGQKEREGSVIIVKSMSKKNRRNSIRSHSLQTHRELSSDAHDLREHFERRASTSDSWWKFSS